MLPWSIFGQRDDKGQPLIIEEKIIGITDADKEGRKPCYPGH